MNKIILKIPKNYNKDRNAARRRRGYGKGNDGGLNDDKWFNDCVCVYFDWCGRY